MLGLEEGTGLNFFDLRCVAKRNGAALDIHLCDSAEGHTVDAFRRHVVGQCADAASPSVMIISFHRPSLQQTGVGHFSPLAAYDDVSDSVLILDVARFKYPPFWASVPEVYAAMQVAEPVSGRPRGYAFVSSSDGACCKDSTHEACSTLCKTPHR
jgi:glutathione gamma-glutamylcysteinyltransferase